MMSDQRRYRPPEQIRWAEAGDAIIVLDQTELPARRVEKELRTVEAVEEAIQSLRVRGAPLIGITAAMGIAALARRAVLEAEAAGGTLSIDDLAERLRAWCDRLEQARPTAVNLVWAIDRMRRAAALTAAGSTGGTIASAAALAEGLRAEAGDILEEDRMMCRRIGEHAAALLRDGSSVITHCNAGALATGGIGTALAPVYVATEQGKKISVYADETRPLLQGSRITAWELAEAGVEVTVIADNMAGALFATDPPDIAFVGSDRIAANGDVANKIGTYGLAVLAHHHGVPFYVLAPTSTVDLHTASGDQIPIEQRSADEIRQGFGRLTAPAQAPVWSPAFDVTPNELVTGIVTEQGVHRAPYVESLREAVAAAERDRAERGRS
ncbi:MAG: S-methyl-5-thioribose-1-phosphate isomerase [Gemmatimonadota bacterium]|jgi:methylthioribose-1-phosphate isomerase|nr:MAG: S-methyl-5-thioribose-1-phosphate isomerase [Gemmatimonadota bacterium]